MCAKIEGKTIIQPTKKGLGQEQSTYPKGHGMGMYFQQRTHSTHLCAKKFKHRSDKRADCEHEREWALGDRLYRDLQPAERLALRSLVVDWNDSHENTLNNYSIWMKLMLKEKMDKLYIDEMGAELEVSAEYIDKDTRKIKAEIRPPYGDILNKAPFQDLGRFA